MALVEEVLLGGAVGALIQAIVTANEKATFFKKALRNLKSTLESVGPIMDQVIESEEVPSDVSTGFDQQLRKAKTLVEMYSDMSKWRFLKRRRVRKLIQEMDDSLQRLLARDFQAKQLAYLTVIYQDVAKMNRKMDRVIALLEGNKADGFDFPEPDEEGDLSSPENDSSSDESLERSPVVGVAFEQLCDSVVAAVVRSSDPDLKVQLQFLEATVKILSRKFQESGELLLRLEKKFPDEVVKVQQLLGKAKQLVSESSGVSARNLLKKWKCKKRLVDLELSLKEILGIDFPAAGLNYTAQVFVKVIEMNKKLDVMFDD